MSEIKPTPYSHVIHYLGGGYESSGDTYADLQKIFSVMPWCNKVTPLDSLIQHLLECWKTVRGNAEIKEHEILELLSEDLNPNSLKNRLLQGSNEYKDLIVSSLLGKIVSTRKVDNLGKPNYVLLPLDEGLRDLMEGGASDVRV